MAARKDGKKQISLWVPADLVKRMKHWAVRRDTTASALVTRIIEESDEVDFLVFANLNQGEPE